MVRHWFDTMIAFHRQVSEYASKEYSLERALDKMQGDWVGVEFDYMTWRETGSTILRGLDDVQMLLDDQIVKVRPCPIRATPAASQPNAPRRYSMSTG
jgi:dynein heavy chain